MIHFRYVFVAVLSVLAAGSFAQPLQYPPSEKGDVTDSYFGVKVPDPYRWLEDDTSQAVAGWVARQNEVTFEYLSRIPFREKLKNRLEQIFNYPKYSTPVRKGKYYVFSKNDGLQNQAVYYIQEGLSGMPTVLLDPNTWSEDGTIKLASLDLSRDGKYLAYSISRGGSDWREFFIMEVGSRTLLPDHIQWAKFSGAAWHEDGFFYSKYDPPADTLKALSAKNENHKVYYHRIGTLQQDDILVFEDRNNPLRFHGVSVTEDGRFAILSISDRGRGRNGNAVFVRDLKKGEKSFKPLVHQFENSIRVIDNIDSKLLVKTNTGAPNELVVLIDPAKPEQKHWEVILPEKDHLLEGVTVAGGKLLVTYLKDVSHRAYVYSLDGKLDHELRLPTLGTVSFSGGRRDDNIIFYTFTSFTFPTSIYKFDIGKEQAELFRQSEVSFVPEDFETRQVFFPSKDGTRVPMFITRKKGMELDGNNPTLLYGYGGFNISQRPAFNSLVIALLEQGVVYCVVNLRGGGEYGKSWHQAGTVLNKQNVFDDFIAAGEWLIANKYTSTEKLAMQGGSNGGLLVGAVMCQRPDLFKVALPAVGVMDMLRYHTFTIGWNWKPDYGSSEDSVQFHALYRYSPLHNLRDGVSYPATLVTTANRDDRVVPAHSYKFAATLQEKHRGNNPVLIRVETKSGHGASNTTKQIAATSDAYSFLLYNLNVNPQWP
ncbi:MAG: S9 family peptidase [Bacteroidetes bacterium]|nr:S9 family peptidase [Bacteroidota bacterium]MCW5897312.1 S9 family peptidase [Bacteroidota bacterium]